MAAKNNIQSTTSFTDLPRDFVIDVFASLPAKTLIRSSVVSKTWYSIIQNRDLMSAHIRRYVSSCDKNAVLIVPPYIPARPYAHLISAETASVIERFDVPFTTKTGSLKVLGSIDGLLLLTDLHSYYDSRDLYLWNPSVRVHRKIVSSCFEKIIDFDITTSCNAGFGFCKSSNDYRVVRIVYSLDSDMRWGVDVAPLVEIYSLKIKSWRKIIEPAVTRYIGHGTGTYINGRYYWLTRTQGVTNRASELWLLWFDFDNELFGELKASDELCSCALNDEKLQQLMVFEESLCLCVFGQEGSHGQYSNPCYIWVMRQEEDGGIFWELDFKVVPDLYGWPMNITKSGRLLLESHPYPRLMDLSVIFSCDLKTNSYNRLGYGKCGGLRDDIFYRLTPSTVDTAFVESLVMYEGGPSVVKYAN